MSDGKQLRPYHFKKGQSGNPKGRPVFPDIKDALHKVMMEEKEGMTALDAILKRLRQMATSGNIKAIQEILDRVYGKSQQKIDHTTQGEKIDAVNVIVHGSDTAEELTAFQKELSQNDNENNPGVQPDIEEPQE